MNEKSNLQLKLNFILIRKSWKNLAFIQQFCNKTVKHKYKIYFQKLFFRIQKTITKSSMQQKTTAEF